MSTSVRVNKELIKEAKEVGLNVSKVIEIALRIMIKQLKEGTRLIAEPNGLSNEPKPVSKCYVCPVKEFKEFMEVDLLLENYTIHRHLLNIKRFEKWLKEKEIKEVTKDDIRQFLLEYKQGRKEASYNNMLKSLRRYFRDYLKQDEIINGFKFMSPKINFITVPSKEDIKVFYDAIDNPDFKFYFLLALSTGLRRNELVNLKVKDVDFNNRVITPNHQTKTKRSYYVFYPTNLDEIIKEHIKNKTKEDRLFNLSYWQVDKEFKRISDKTKIRITSQVLRQWYSNELSMFGVQDRYIEFLTGKVPKTILSKNYTDYSISRIKEIYDNRVNKKLNQFVIYLYG